VSEPYDTAPCGYLSTRPDGTIIRVNETFLDWTGYTRAQLVDRMRFRDLLTVGGRIFHETHFAPLILMQGGVKEIALDIARPGARPLPVLINATSADGVTQLSVFDATDRRAYERELVAERRRAERSEERLRMLQAATARLARAGTEEDVLDEVVRAGVHDLGATRAEIWLAADEGAVMTVARSAGSEHAAHVAHVPLTGADGPLGALVLELPDEPADSLLDTLGELAAQALERARSHWHLRRIQEVLPICMDCETVKPGAEWVSIVDYLRDNALMLSHGLCPACAARREAELGAAGL
jgi:hypothetical protein